MKLKFFLMSLFAVALIAMPLAAQSTGRITGNISDSDDAGLPGVTITLESDNLQGSRVIVSESNGGFASPPLPPGEYEVTFQLEGFQAATQRVKVNAAQTLPMDVILGSGSISEEIVVTGEATQAISQTSTKSSTITSEELDALPVGRALGNAVALSPGVATGVNGDSINGAQSWDNLYTLNGVVLNENIRGQEFELFIEDEIQETTIQTGAISAEYGRFTGGVVNAISKSGGNNFEGSIRTTFDNEDWLGKNDFSPETREDTLNHTLEATLGGRIMRDKLWFFAAGRDRSTEGTGTSFLNISYPTGTDNSRLSGKLTLGMTEKHQLQAGYTEIENDQTGVPHGGLSNFLATIDDGSLDDVRSLPQELNVLSYTGVLTPNFFVEARVTDRQFFFEGSGGGDDAIDTGTPVWDLVNNIIVNESLFCDDTKVDGCIPEERSNETWFGKGSYFLAGDQGSHDLAFGVESFTDIRAADNHQSPNDLMIWNFAESQIVGDKVFPLLLPGATTIQYLPILNPTQGTAFETQSAFVNDSWRVNDRLSVSLGARFDELDAVNSLGLQVAKNSAVSPRIGATYDLKGDGEHVLHAFVGQYVGHAAGGVFNSSSPAGSPAQFGFDYFGPDSGFFDPVTFNQKVFSWFFDVCPNALADPFSCPFLFDVDIPGATTLLDTGLGSTTATEFSLGYQTNIGTYGGIRVDLSAREFGDFLLERVDLGTGQGTTETGAPFDKGLIVNNDSIANRDYYGASVITNLRFLDGKLRVGANATVSHLYGNLNGETSGSGAISDSSLTSYPEYRFAENSPTGDLSNDQRFRARVWAIYDLFSNDRHNVSVSMLQSFLSGQPYSAIGTVDPRPYVTNPGYITPPGDLDYYFGGRGAFTTDDVTRTDLQFNYSVDFGRFSVFVIPSVTNLFNEDAVDDPNTSVTTGFETSTLSTWNPFTETPVEGTHWRKGSNFGKATEEDDLQNVREFQISVGFRWNPR